MQCQVDIGSPADSDQYQVRGWDRTDRITESARDSMLVLDAKGSVEVERIAVGKDKCIDKSAVGCDGFRCGLPQRFHRSFVDGVILQMSFFHGVKHRAPQRVSFFSGRQVECRIEFERFLKLLPA